ncbi:MAG TPA: hypothetical protein VEV15_06950 [Flavisolibacter sp.]|nr:hypothetical protein [Flavisolibacter sp.]
MKYILFLCGCCFLFLTGLKAQTRTDVKLYAYARPVAGGVPPKISTQENNLQAYSSAKAKYNYLIYLEGPATTRIYPVEMWLYGEKKGLRTTIVTTTPVEIKTGELPPYSKTITLVPETSNTVYQLDLGMAVPGKEMAAARAKARTNEVVVVYKYAGKFYYAAEKKIKILEPVVLQ